MSANDTLSVFFRSMPEVGAKEVGRAAFDPKEHAFHPWPTDADEAAALEKSMTDFAVAEGIIAAPKKARASSSS